MKNAIGELRSIVAGGGAWHDVNTILHVVGKDAYENELKHYVKTVVLPKFERRDMSYFVPPEHHLFDIYNGAFIQNIEQARILGGPHPHITRLEIDGYNAPSLKTLGAQLPYIENLDIGQAYFDNYEPTTIMPMPNLRSLVCHGDRYKALIHLDHLLDHLDVEATGWGLLTALRTFKTRHLLLRRVHGGYFPRIISDTEDIEHLHLKRCGVNVGHVRALSRLRIAPNLKTLIVENAHLPISALQDIKATSLLESIKITR